MTTGQTFCYLSFQAQRLRRAAQLLRGGSAGSRNRDARSSSLQGMVRRCGHLEERCLSKGAHLGEPSLNGKSMSDTESKSFLVFG